MRLFPIVAALGGAVFLAGAAPSAVHSATKANRSQAAATIQEALRQEIAGSNADRRALLDLALEQAPDWPQALWHNGFVHQRNQWIKFDELPDQSADNARLDAYRRARAKHPDTVQGQLALAEWCGKKKLADQQRAHLTRVLDLDPSNADARRLLGYRQVGGAWVTDAEVAEANQRAQAAFTALRQWKPKLERLRRELERRDSPQARAAMERFQAIRDPATVGPIELVFCASSEKHALTALEALERMPAPEASMAICRQALVSPWETVRRTAAQKLKTRDVQTYVPPLLASMETPVQSRAQLYRAPSGRLVYSHVLAREGQEQNNLAVFETQYPLALLSPATADAARDVLDALRGQDAVRKAQVREVALARQNAAITQFNQRIAAVLATATGQDLPPSSDAWWKWWNDYNETYTVASKPVQTTYRRELVSLSNPFPYPPPPEPPPPSVSLPPTSLSSMMECFVAGTQVWTDSGLVPIERLQTGDRVLSQDPDSGELACKPVLRTTTRPAERLLRVEVGSQSFQCTGGHPFWVCGRGWMKVRDLQPGMRLHGVGGAQRVRSVAQSGFEPTYNLIVADFHTYFVGRTPVLSHDNTIRRPPHVRVPGMDESAPEPIEKKSANPGATPRRRTAQLNETPAGATGRSGYVRWRNDWVHFQALAESFAADPIREAYRERRSQAAPTVQGQVELAKWCEQQGLVEERYAHLMCAVQLAPRNPELCELLGYKLEHGRWIAPEEGERAQQAARDLERWLPVIRDIRDDLASSSSQRQDVASESLFRLTDPAAIGAMEQVLAPHSEELALRCVATLRGMASPEASVALAKQAVLSPWPSVRGMAAGLLKGRDLHEVMPRLIATMGQVGDARLPWSNDIVSAWGLNDLESPYALPMASSAELAWAESKIEAPLDKPKQTVSPNGSWRDLRVSPSASPDSREETVGLDGPAFQADRPTARPVRRTGAAMSVVASASAAKKRVQASHRRANLGHLDDADVPATPQASLKSRIRELLAELTKQYHWPSGTENSLSRVQIRWNLLLDQGRPGDWLTARFVQDGWVRWWLLENEVNVAPRKLVRSDAHQTLGVGRLASTAEQLRSSDPVSYYYQTSGSCFPAGTPVWTASGFLDIEKIKIGDLVLSQDPETQELAYKPVLATTLRQPSDLFTVRLDGDTFQATGGHLFWVDGQGWVKVRDLQSGTRLRTASGTMLIEGRAATEATWTYNLVVADFHSYFIGRSRLLAHDVTIRKAMTKAAEKE